MAHQGRLEDAAFLKILYFGISVVMIRDGDGVYYGLGMIVPPKVHMLEVWSPL